MRKTHKPSAATKKGPSRPHSSRTTPEMTDELLLESYKTMVLARLIDEKTITLYKQNKCHFQISCAGHEAVQVAAAHVFRPGHDWFYPYYRDMALVVGLGVTPLDLMLNAMNKEEDPNSHGRMMPMHYGSTALKIAPQSSPTGSQFLQAVGCAVGAKMKHLDEVIYVSAGEGTCSQGDFHEAVNWSAREKLPIVFLIENNEYAISVHISEQIAGESVSNLVKGYEHMEAVSINGSDIEASFHALQAAHQRAQKGFGPTLIEARVPRLQSHSISDNHLKYRTAEDLAKEQLRCPLRLTRLQLLDRKIVSQGELEQIHTELKKVVDEAQEIAEQRADADVAHATAHVYRNPTPWVGITEEEAGGPEIFMVDAINHALDEELARNPDVCIFGEDVAHGKGGVFTVTAGLTAKHGVKRVFNSQLAESAIVGAAIGLATRGLKPVAEIQFGDYVWTGTNQIRNELAMIHYRCGGEFSCPAVIRLPVGGYIRGGAYHSQNIEATFAHFPGLFVLYPSNATDAKGLLKAAIRAQDPVLFLEHKGLYRQVYAKGAEGHADFLTPIGKAKTVREGKHATIVTWGALVHKSLLAAHAMEDRGYSIEVIDLRTIVPLDIEHVFESVRKTGRVLVAHEDVVFGGFGGEIVSQIADSCFTYLEAPIKRVGMKTVSAVPHAPGLEDAILPQTEDITASLLKLVGF